MDCGRVERAEAEAARKKRETKGRDGRGKARKKETEWRAGSRRRGRAGELKSKIESEGKRDRARGKRNGGARRRGKWREPKEGGERQGREGRRKGKQREKEGTKGREGKAAEGNGREGGKAGKAGKAGSGKGRGRVGRAAERRDGREGMQDKRWKNRDGSGSESGTARARERKKRITSQIQGMADTPATSASQRPKRSIAPFLLRIILVYRDVHYRARRRARWQKIIIRRMIFVHTVDGYEYGLDARHPRVVSNSREFRAPNSSGPRTTALLVVTSHAIVFG
ncbi:hypothetical protein B0H14DRAFT_3127324 [Mycena olivaceomarginata]|nr:hypothetical protein B0H14DRAFT_3127324 [Mycena olivaceomarginata]